MPISLIVAMAKNRVIGNNNQMPWHLPADFAYFRKITTGHPIIMGRKTYDSIGRPLPGRRNIIVSRNSAFCVDGAEVAGSLGAAIDACQGEDAFIIGGASLYAEALPRADRIYLTEIDALPEGETLFPMLDDNEWHEVARERREADGKNCYAMAFIVLDRKSAPRKSGR